MSEYHPVPPKVDLPELERDVLAFWRQHDVFAASLEQTAGGEPWTFYEGPPTANGAPGVHHVEARVFKDVFPRFKTMQGYRVDRKGGWDCQGLHVEVGVEKELGVSGKQQIEEYGIAEFNARCRESVLRHIDDFAEMTDRMGYWVDLEHAYRTMDTSYIESVWWSLKQIFDKGLLYQSDRVSPYCPRCETALSDHELGQPGGYETVTDPSVYLRMPLTSGPWQGASLLVWTTTPWTLVSNTAVAVNPEVSYLLAGNGEERLVVAEPLLGTVLGEGWSVEGSVTGREMERWRYRRPFELVDFPRDAWYVVLADYVTTDDGTGLVHQSPAFGADDLTVCRAYGLPVVNPVRADGHFADEVPLVGGQFFKHADTDLVKDLTARELLWRHVPYEHSYPHCWRCHTPLIYYAMPAWYIRTTAVKDRLLEENERTTWFPATIKWGRYGDWLRNNVDWSLSRTRFWGTPLPIWACPDGHLTCAGSLEELGTLAEQDLSGLDPHRPYVDEVVFECPQCGADAHRVSEVIDAWYDSGSMPFAQWGHPYADGSADKLAATYPADFICEAIDQTRGWFYSLMAIGTLLFDESPYRNVLCLGLLLAEDGRKMSKHLGNIVEPMAVMDRHGADAVRWFMAASGSPWAARRFGDQVLQEIVRKVLLTYWNTVAFQVLYARAASWSPDSNEAPDVGDRPVLDRWLVGETARLVEQVTTALERFDTQRAGSLLARFVDDLSNWYVRRSRRRFWAGDAAALRTLHDTLVTVTTLLAPLVPFITERVWQDLVRPVELGVPVSVHLSKWPTPDGSPVSAQLSASVSLARRLVELGRAARAEAKVRTRQPLARAVVGSAAFEALTDDLRAEVADELNVETLESLAAGTDLVDYSAKGNFRALGRRFGQQTPDVAAAIAAADAGMLAEALNRSGAAVVVVDGSEVEVSPEEVTVSERPRAGWSVVNEQGETVALDLELTPRLRRAGLAREVVRLVQEARKSSGLEITDRVELVWEASGETAAALAEHADLVSGEVLATRMRQGTPGANVVRDDELGLGFSVQKA